MYTFDFCCFIRKSLKQETNSKKPNAFFCFFVCFTECKYDAYLLNQHRQLTNGRNVCSAIFC